MTRNADKDGPVRCDEGAGRDERRCSIIPSAPSRSHFHNFTGTLASNFRIAPQSRRNRPGTLSPQFPLPSRSRPVRQDALCTGRQHQPASQVTAMSGRQGKSPLEPAAGATGSASQSQGGKLYGNAGASK